MSTQAKQLVTHLGFADSYSFGKNGLERDQIVHLAKGTFLHAFCYNQVKQQYVVFDDNMNAVEICQGNPFDIKESDLVGRFKPIQHLSSTTKSIDNVCGIGFYYDTSKIVSDEIIEKSLKRAENLKKLELEVEERKAKEKEETRARLIIEYDFLIRNEDNDHNIVGKNIRTELKRNFPDIKFSVRYCSFNAFYISWNDGPTSKQVDAVVKKHQHSHADPDPNVDGHFYRPSVFNELFGGVSYVSTFRDITEKAIETMRMKYPDLTEENKATYRFEDDTKLYRNRPVNEILRELAREVDFSAIRIVL